jgi:hypothetical protein
MNRKAGMKVSSAAAAVGNHGMDATASCEAVLVANCTVNTKALIAGVMAGNRKSDITALLAAILVTNRKTRTEAWPRADSEGGILMAARRGAIITDLLMSSDRCERGECMAGRNTASLVRVARGRNDFP